MFEVSRHGFDGEPRVNFDSVGKLYISIAIIWTILVGCGSGFLLYHRDLPTLRVRNTHLWTTAIAFLHSYWVLCLIAYVLNGSYPCTAEFWIMSLWLPFGIAVYQVNGMHLLHIASLQTRFIHPQALHAYRGSRSGKSGWWSLRRMGLPDSLSKLQKIFIAGGMVLQILVSLAIYCISRKFHPAWGAVGHAVGPVECRRGWEWVPSIIWQFFWTWIYAPYLLWNVRKIHDLHGWRLQTIIGCAGGLLGSPMWLATLYSPEYSSGLAKVSRYFVPPLWFTPGIVAMEISIILIPCIMVVKSRRLHTEMLRQLLEWERKEDSGTSVDTGSTYLPTSDEFSIPSPTPSNNPIRSELYSMKALEKALATNITPLLRFSALKDFSGENISFLKHVHDWKATWATASSHPPSPSTPPPPPPRFSLLTKKSSPNPPAASPLLDPTSLRHHQFSLAVEIFISFISPLYSDFPLNLSFTQLKDLESVFGPAASTLNAPIQENTATPFDAFPWPPTPISPPAAAAADPDTEPPHDHAAPLTTTVSTTPEKDTISIASTAVSPTKTNQHAKSTSSSSTTAPELAALIPRLHPSIAIPLSFDPHVFDEAEKAVKYVVLTNTWPKFVGAGLAGRERGGERDGGRERERERGKGGSVGKEDEEGGLGFGFGFGFKGEKGWWGGDE